MTRRPIVAGNWKMHLVQQDAADLARALARAVGMMPDRDVVIAPSFTALGAVRDAIFGTEIGLAAQNGHWEAQGAFTGEVSMPMLVDAGCRYVIIGHSERRHYFRESSETCRKKIRAALAASLTPVYCVGETLDQRESAETFPVLEKQLRDGLHEFTAEDIATLVIAYEPVWAIGTGKTASPAQAQEVHAFIRDWLVKRFDGPTAEALRLQYGGSVKPDNVDELMSQPDIDGTLVGGAALKADSFERIVRFIV
jgi:triosephosphate isomerase